MLATSKNSSFEGSYPVPEEKIAIKSSNNDVSENKERTLGLLPCTDSLKDIINLIKTEGFTIVDTKTTQFTLKQAQEFYADSRARKCYDNNYFDKMENWLGSGSDICALVLEKENAVKDWRHLMGPANYKKARKSNPNSIRALFYKDASQNATHGSDSENSAKTEIEFVFGDSPIYATNKSLPHNTDEIQGETTESDEQLVPAKDDKKEQAEIKDISSTPSQDLGDKSEDNIDTGLTKTSDKIVPADIKEEHTKINESFDHAENTATTIPNEATSIKPDDSRVIPEKNSETASESTENDLVEEDESTSVEKVDKGPIETPTETVESPSGGNRDQQGQESNNAPTGIKEEVKTLASTEIKVDKDNLAAHIEPEVEKTSEVGSTEMHAGVDPSENENAVLNIEEEGKVENTQVKDSKSLAIEDSKIPLKEEEMDSVDETKDVSTTATPSPVLSEHNLTTTNSTDVDTEKEEDSQANEVNKDLQEENTSEKVEEEAPKTENEGEVKKHSTNLKINTSQKTNSTKEPKKNIAASASRIKPPSSINKTHTSARSSAPTSVPTRQASINASKPSKAGATRIARLSPSATLNTETAATDKKKRIAPPRDNGVPSVAKKAVTRVSKNLPRVALMTSQKPPKTPEKNDDEEAEKKPKKRTSSTRSFISRLTTPTVASANKKTDSDTPAVSSTTKTAKRSSLPSKRSSTVRPMSLTSKDALLRNKQNTDAANLNNKGEQSADAKETQQQQEQLST